MRLNKSSWPVPGIFKLIQDQGNIPDKEMFTVFNMGIGMLVVVEKKHADRALSRLKKYCKCYIVGEVIRSNKSMELI